MNPLTHTSNQSSDPSAAPGDAGLRVYFIDRLKRLQHRRAEMMGIERNPDRKLIDHALYSTYWDCVGVGMKEEAREILGTPEPLLS